jgi:hypothetical protein
MTVSDELGRINGREETDAVAPDNDSGSEERPMGALAEPPLPPKWEAGRSGFFARRLIRISGVDPNLAFKMPADEQLQMKRVGAALLFGVALQGVLFGTCLTIGFGFQSWTLPVTLVICGVMWAFDTKFVAADWVAQGEAFCRAYGLISAGTRGDKWKRIGTWSIRWAVAAFIAWSLAVFIQEKLFDPAIRAHWAEDYRAQNRPIVQAVTARYEAVIAQKSDDLHSAKQRIETLNTQRTALAEGTTVSTADVDQQIANHLAHITKLQTDRDNALQSANSQRKDVIAERFGVRLHEGNTGLVGEGSRYNFHNDMARQYESVAQALSAEIESETKAVADLQRQRVAIQASARSANQAQLNAIDEQLSEERANEAGLSDEYRKLQDGREAWIAAHVRESPGYVPMQSGIVSELQALAAITTGNWLIASLVFFTKVLIMLLESAGPIAKVAFTSPGLYQMTAALRVHDAAEMETDRRLKWEHWRLKTRSRSHDAIDAIKRVQRRRVTEDQARNALNKIMQKFSWMH